MKKRIVIAGLGDTGLLVALNLPKSYDIIGVSPKPCLVSGQELGTRLAQPALWKKNYLIDFFRFQKLDGRTLVHGEITHIDAKANSVHLTDINGSKLSIHYDALVISSGVSNGFWRNNRLQDQTSINNDITLQAQAFANAQTIAIIGAGASGVSAASNLKERFPEKAIHLFYSQTLPLPGYHEKVRAYIASTLQQQGVHLHPQHRAITDADAANTLSLTPQSIRFSTEQEPFACDIALWAVGNVKANNGFIPKELLNEQGFVITNEELRSPFYNNIFAVGDIAATDPNRSSARNAGFLIAAHNIDCLLNNKAHKMKHFTAPSYRWGSILGLQKNGLRIFTPKGASLLVRPWLVINVLFPMIVHKLIYKGLRHEARNKA